MNATLITSFWRQRLTSPVRMVIAALLFGFPVLTVTAMRTGLGPLGDSTGLVMVFAAGMIGQDLSSGVLQLLFARPVRRAEYVFSRWFAVGSAAAGLGLVQVGVATALLHARGAGPALDGAALFAAQRVLECFGLAAIFALLSSLIGGVGDLALYLIGTFVATIAGFVGQAQQWPAFSRAAAELTGLLTPSLDLAQIAGTSPVPLFPIASYASSVALGLLLAVVVMNRREFSYASAS